MKKLFLSLFVISFTTSIYSQEAVTSHTKEKEYASVYLKVLYQGNVIQYDKKGWSKSPIISMPDGKYAFLYDATDIANPKEFKLLNEVLNYMASFGWEVKNIVVLPFSGGTGNASGNDLINTSVYLEEIVFERNIK